MDPRERQHRLYHWQGFLRRGGVSRLPRYGTRGYLERYKYPPDEILCFTFLQRNPFYFYRYYRERILPYVLSAQPSPAHEALARLEEAGKLKAILTVNIDGIHQEAGSKHVLELQGSVMRSWCGKCEKFLDFLLHHRQPHPHPLLQRRHVRGLCPPGHCPQGRAL